MPVLIERQRRAREIGRIRLGAHKESNRPGRPLSTFRLTSPDRAVLNSAAATYGGAVAEWGDQYEVVVGVAELPVIIPPHAGVLTQWMELWNGGGCVRRCDGEVCVLTDGQTGEITEVACLCADIDEPPCKPTTRLSVILRDLPGVGVWRCETHGRIALDELDQTIGTLAIAWSRGTIVPGRLRIEKRSIRRPGKPRSDFVVPVLDIDMSVMELLSGATPSLGGAPVSASLPPSTQDPPAPPQVDTDEVTGGSCTSHQAGDTCQLPVGHRGAHRHDGRGWVSRIEDGR